MGTRSPRKVTIDRNALVRPAVPCLMDFRSKLFLFFEALQLMIKAYRELNGGNVWLQIKEELAEEHVKPLHDDKVMIAGKLEKMRAVSFVLQEEQCNIWQKCESDRVAEEQRPYTHLNEGSRLLRTLPRTTK
jgi:hypothetical protein